MNTPSTKVTFTCVIDDPEIEKICADYWCINDSNKFVHTLKAIGEPFQLTGYQVGKFVEAHCSAHSTQFFCTLCVEPYAYKNRGDYVRNHSQKAMKGWMCKSCEAELQKIEEELRRSREKQKRIALTDNFNAKPEINIYDLDFKSLVYLMAFIKQSRDYNEKGYIEAYKRLNAPQKLSCSSDFDTEIINHLKKNNLTAISPKSDVSMIDISNDDNTSISYYPSRVCWEIPFDLKQYPTRFDFNERLRNHLDRTVLPDDWKSSAIDLYKTVLMQECIAYLKHQLEANGLDERFNAGEKTYSVFRRVLQHYPLSQIYNFIWGATKDAYSYYSGGGIYKKQATNSVIGRIELRYNRARHFGSEVKPFGQIYDLSHSSLNQVLFNTVFKLEDDIWFYETQGTCLEDILFI